MEVSIIKNRGTGIGIIDKMLVTHQPNIIVDAAQMPNWLDELKRKLKTSAEAGQDVIEIKDNVTPVKNVYLASASRGSVINIGEELWLIRGDSENLNEQEM